MQYMKRTLLHISIALIFSLCTLSCVREALPGGSDREGVEVTATLDFAPQANVEVSTKATLDGLSENRVLNLFVFLFDSHGNKLYSQYFDSSNKQNVTSSSALSGEGWWVSNGETLTQGGVRIKATSGSGYKIYAMSNLDADMVRVSSDLLSHNINNEQQLKDFSIYLNQEIVSRNGYFPMTGMLDGLKIDTSGKITKDDGSAPGPLMLRRLDAKIKFIFKAGTREDERRQTITSFTAKQWRVMNVPATAYLVERDIDSGDVPPTTPTGDYVNYAPKYFDTDWVNFEEFPDDNTKRFSFYMLENRLTPKNTALGSYQDRSRQVKQTSGYHIGENESVTVTYVNSRGVDVTRDMRVFSNANDFSTYVLVTGRVEMTLVNDSAGQTLGGDVQYLIHLGDWNFTEGSSWSADAYTGGFDNFNTERNTSYTYTVTVNSVNNIRVEVETAGGSDTENQPGASGEVTIAKEEIAICDAHYYSKTMTFHAKNFFEGLTSTADQLTWRVKTPFSDDTPDDPLNPGTLDYDWVHFRLNKRDATTGLYKEERRKFVDPTRKFEYSSTYRDASTNKESDGTDGLAGYHNDGLMNIIDLVKYIKEQAALLEAYWKNPGLTYTGDFESPDDRANAKIRVTAFVDEFYYDKNPVTGVTSPTLWKSFVNQPDRSLHILCDSRASTDLESRATGSVITIQQHAIQTIYNTDPAHTSLQTAWGLEYVDEFTDQVTTYNVSATNYLDSGNNTSAFNGLYNSVKEWDISTSGTSSWGTYLEYETKNDVPQMKDKYKALRYICMSRNRDNNGNGTIDPDEIRWYTASIQQLIGLYVGGGVIDHHSRVYYRSAAEQASTNVDDWMQHIVSSTQHSEGRAHGPLVIWGEEGISTSSLNQANTWTGYTKKFSVRCVRNLGVDNPASFTFDKDEYTPQDYVDIDTEGSGSSAVVTFNATNLNSAALRYYTSRELEYHSNNSEMNRLYKRFQFCSTDKAITTPSLTFKGINNNVTAAINTGQKNPYCPDGYRLPNQTELAMILYYVGGIDKSVTRTYWDFGVDGAGNTSGKDKQGGTNYGYTYNGTNITVAEAPWDFKTRCVRDIRTD